MTIGILGAVVPLQVTDNCGDTQPLNCGPDGVVSDSASRDLKIEFPDFLTGSAKDTLPLAGGAVISISIKDFKIKSTDSVTNIINRDIRPLGDLELQNKLEDLVTARLAINKAYLNIAKREINVLSATKSPTKTENRTAPQVFISRFVGDSSKLVDGQDNPSIIKMCEMKFIPLAAIQETARFILSKSPEFAQVVGVSGRTFAQLLTAAESLGEIPDETGGGTAIDVAGVAGSIAEGDASGAAADAVSSAVDSAGSIIGGGSSAAAVDLVLEFFAIYNIPEVNISSSSGTTPIGGYYTIIEDKIYLKTPDLSGRDSVGLGFSTIDEESTLWIEIKSGGTITRAEIEKFKNPPVGFLTGPSPPDEFPDSSSLEVKIETLVEEKNLKVYLSPITGGVSVKSNQFIKTFDNSIEVLSVPVLTLPISNKGGRLPTFNDNLIDVTNIEEAYANSAEKVTAYFGETNKSKAELQKMGYPYFGSEDAHIFFGEKNRPEILLAGRGEDLFAFPENDNKYHNPGSYGVIQILNSVRPKVYNDVPSAWIGVKAKLDKEVENEDKTSYIAKFSPSKFSKMNTAAIGDPVKFAVYIEDSIGQVTRVIGSNIELTAPVPSIDKITPNGFAGGPLLIFNDPAAIIKIQGEGFGSASSVRFSGVGRSTFLISNGEPGATFGASQIEIKIASSGKFGLNQVHNVEVVAGSQSSNPETIFISANSLSIAPEKDAILAFFRDGEIKSDETGSNPITGIPLLRDGQSAEVRVKSKSRIFSGNTEVYAYLAFDDNKESESVVSKFAFPEDIAKFKDNNRDLIIPTNVQYKFDKSITADFFKVPFSSKKAGLRFPGKYSAYNFSGLVGLGKVYFIFTNRALTDFGGVFTSIVDSDYDIIEVGDGDIGSGFVEPAVVAGIAANIAGDISSTFNKEDLPGTLEEAFPTGNIRQGAELNTFDNISRLLVVVPGAEERFLKKRYTIKIAGEDIKSNLVGKPKVIGSNIIFTYDNIYPKNDGVLAVTVEKKDKIFNVKTDSANIFRQGSALIKSKGTNFDIEEKTKILTLKKDIISLISGSEKNSKNGTESVTDFLGVDNDLIEAFIGAENITDDNKAELIFKTLGTGILFNKSSFLRSTHFLPFTTINLLPTVSMKLGNSNNPYAETDFGISSPKDAIILSKKVLTLKSGGFIRSDSYIHQSLKNTSSVVDAALLFFNVRVTNGASVIKHNVPIITHISEGKVNDPEVFNENSVIKLVVGQYLTVRVCNTRRDFILRFGEANLKPIGRPKRVDGVPGCYDAVIKIPVTLAGGALKDGVCFEICASTDNADRNGAKGALGRAFVVDLEDTFKDLLGGKLKEGMADIQSLVEKLAAAPLQFINNLMDKALAHKDLINAFCDLSFHLLAELKINLNGLLVLMIPIQIILCIIDVICALLNPINLAKAVIRLFQCLYDLILLLPPISIPAMFLRLILHLLELLECVIEKILFTIIAINEISKAIANAIEDKNWAAIKALEEVLSEYLFEIEADLSFLEPVLAILAAFLQLLQLVFRFPCKPSTGEDPPVCIDGSMLAGLVGGIVAPDLEILPDALIPVAQPYSTNSLGRTRDSDLVEPANNDLVASAVSGTYLSSMNVDADSTRADGGFAFNVTFGPTITKSKKGFGSSVGVEFQFKERAKTNFNDKMIDPTQTVDSPLVLMKVSSDEMFIDLNGAGGTFISPIDGFTFLNKSVNSSGNGTASVKPLVIDIETPELGVDEDTGQVINEGVQTARRTFDDIPSMAIMDEEFNLYFIEKDGIEFEDSMITSIKAKMVNNVAAPKLKFSREEEEFEKPGSDPPVEDSSSPIKIFDLPQIYFVDIRQAAEQISEACAASSINTFLFDFNDTDTDQIEDIVEGAQKCLNTYLSDVRNLVGAARKSQEEGRVPDIIDTNKFDNFNKILKKCLEEAADDMCKFVVNSLNTSFQVLEDIDQTPLSDFTSGNVSDGTLEGLPDVRQPFTGAREYAEGIGDSAIIGSGDTANILVIPRDSYDIALGGDLTENIILEIISDETGTAEFIKNSEGNVLTKSGTQYTAKITATGIGEVKIKGSICSRTIQAVTYDGIEEDIITVDGIDCIPSTVGGVIGRSPALGALTKVDRVLTVFFVRKSTIIAAQSEDGAEVAKSKPQGFGTGLEN